MEKHQPKVAMLAIYERYDVLEALKSGSSGDDFGWISAGKNWPKGIFEVDFCWENIGMLAMSDTS